MKNVLYVIVLTLMSSFLTNAVASNKKNVCEDYRRQVKEYCSKGYVGYLSGTAGACLGAQIGLAIYKC
ncbi:Heat-stable enterotoxin II [Escherichia coli]|uniref:Heat-stable enterotoxin II n=1 Tax=Escherichia coli TaxID=562 RepID=UPI000D0A9273|nr:Heat-stable enterotoxin II [Escherichia coli]